MSYSEELVETLSKMRYFIETVNDHQNELNERITFLEREEEDVKHIFQVGKLDGKGMAICGSKLGKIRIEREVLKREKLILASLHKTVNTDKGILKTKITQLEQNTKNTQNTMNNKHYNIRSLDKDFVLSVVKNKEVLKSITF